MTLWFPQSCVGLGTGTDWTRESLRNIAFRTRSRAEELWCDGQRSIRGWAEGFLCGGGGGGLLLFFGGECALGGGRHTCST